MIKPSGRSIAEDEARCQPVDVVEQGRLPEPAIADVVEPPATTATVSGECPEIPGFLRRDILSDAVALWNAFAEENGLERVQKLHSQRRTKLKARLKDCGGLEGWKAALEKLGASSFLMKKDRTGEHANWRPDFDFLMRESKFTKLMEGGFDDRSATRDADERDRAGNEAVLRAIEAVEAGDGDAAAGPDAG